MDFSVLMSVYKNDSVEFFKKAMDSILEQTAKPSEIVLVRDGQVPQELQTAIDGYIETTGIINYVPLEENQGLGNALKIGVEKASYELIARMDSDDISVKDRFELQLKELEKNPELDLVGGNIEEFITSPDEIVSERIVPENTEDILEYFKARSPFNHMTVMYKKSAVLKAGNYEEVHYVEDYYLWLRMLFNGCKFYNIQKTLVYARIGEEMYQRRGGKAYYNSLKFLEKFKLENKLIKKSKYTKNLIVRYVQCILLPNSLRGWAYKKFARKTVK